MAQEATRRDQHSEVQKLQADQKQIKDALQLLYDLVESFAPMWYTEAHRDQVKAALRL